MRPRELSRSIDLFAALTPTLPPATHTNSYALGGRDVLLVEPATPYAVASVGTILIEPRDGDMRVYIEQLERLAGLSARWALPAHGEPIENPTATFLRYVSHRLMREDKVIAAVRRGGASGAAVEQLVLDAYSDVGAGTWPLALLSVRAHLKKLLDEGRVHVTGAARYVAPA